MKTTPIVAALDLVKKDTYELSDEARARKVAVTLEGISSRAQPQLKPYIMAVAATMRDIERMIDQLDESRLDLVEFRAASVELINTCDRYVTDLAGS